MFLIILSWERFNMSRLNYGLQIYVEYKMQFCQDRNQKANGSTYWILVFFVFKLDA